MDYNQLNAELQVNLSSDILEKIKTLNKNSACPTANEMDKNEDCEMFIHKCKLLTYYETYIKKYDKEEINIDILNQILKNTIKFGGKTDTQEQLIKYGATPITTIHDDAFSDNKLTAITIPNSVTTIGNRAFLDNKLTELTIPNSVTTISFYAFEKNQLNKVTIPNSVTTIGMYAFFNNQLTELTIPNSVTKINDYAFARNELTELTIPNSVTTIGQGAFALNKLTKVTIPEKFRSWIGYIFGQDNINFTYI
jgi:hypothetical protein